MPTDDVATSAVLAADDDADTRELIRAVLSGAGIACRSVASAEEALDALARHVPRVLVLDVRMPGLSGLEVCRQAKQLKRAQVAVLMVSAEGTAEDLAAAYAVGADDYLTKPFRPRELVRRVRRLLASTNLLPTELDPTQEDARP